MKTKRLQFKVINTQDGDEEINQKQQKIFDTHENPLLLNCKLKKKKLKTE